MGTQYMRKNKFKGHYRVEPLNGKLFAIKAYEEQEPEPEMIYFDLYDEGPESSVVKSKLISWNSAFFFLYLY